MTKFLKLGAVLLTVVPLAACQQADLETGGAEPAPVAAAVQQAPGAAAAVAEGEGCAPVQERGCNCKAGEPAAAEKSVVQAVPVDDSPTRGDHRAAVTIVESCDFECPFCARAQGTLAEIEKAYGNKVRIVFKHNPLPFHEHAMKAALAVEAAREQGRFWEMHDRIFANRKQLDDASFEKLADELGLGRAAFASAMASPAVAKRVAADQALMRSLGARGTPTFWINGRRLTGAQPFAEFQKLIDEELAAKK